MKSKKPKRGRPALAPEDVKKVYPLRFSAVEMAQFEKAAKAEGKTVREWMVEVVKKTAGNGR